MPVLLSGKNIDSLDLVRATLTTEASITATSSATGNTCITTGKFSVENGGNYYVEVFTPYLTKGTTNLDVELFDGATAAAGTFLQSLSGHMTASATLGQGVVLCALVSLIAGSHNLTVTGFVDAGTGKFGAGTGATGQPPPAVIRVRPA
jgi:hypothetical protein